MWVHVDCYTPKITIPLLPASKIDYSDMGGVYDSKKYWSCEEYMLKIRGCDTKDYN